MLYTSLEKLKNRLGITTHDYDDQLNQIIQQATDTIDSYIGENIELKTITEIVDGHGNNKLYLSHLPKDVWEIENRKTGTRYNLDLVRGYILYLEENVEKGKNNVRVLYTTGYEQVPKDIEDICLDLCTIYVSKQTSIQTEQLNKLVDKNIKTQKLGDLSITYFGTNEKKQSSFDTLSPSKNIEKVLNKYKSFKGLYY